MLHDIGVTVHVTYSFDQLCMVMLRRHSDFGILPTILLMEDILHHSEPARHVAHTVTYRCCSTSFFPCLQYFDVSFEHLTHVLSSAWAMAERTPLTIRNPLYKQKHQPTVKTHWQTHKPKACKPCSYQIYAAPRVPRCWKPPREASPSCPGDGVRVSGREKHTRAGDERQVWSTYWEGVNWNC